ncbi:DUF2795 domain-containing protein [Streptomyces sp. NPDC023838]|uniref:DUF2795 domain-containing protein n=1 Tax=Streptomyces sp. NPDC023838 TaxID=3154325 RepID=UPI0033F8F40A
MHVHDPWEDEMAQHGRDKTGAIRDDEAKKRLQGELRANRSTRVEEPYELQPSGEDQPAVERSPNGSLGGATPPGMSPQSVALRTELARHLERRIYPADRELVLKTLRRHRAPDALVERVSRLPEGGLYGDARAVASALEHMGA